MDNEPYYYSYVYSTSAPQQQLLFGFLVVSIAGDDEQLGYT